MSMQPPGFPLTFTEVCQATSRSPRAVRDWIVQLTDPVMIGSDGGYRYTEQDILEARGEGP